MRRVQKFFFILGLLTSVCVARAGAESRLKRDRTRNGFYLVAANWAELNGGWNILRLNVVDSAEKPVLGADLKVVYDMEMKMDPPDFPVEEKGNGNYEKKIYLGMSGLWAFDLKITSNGQEDSLRVMREIKKDPTKNGFYLIDANWSELKRGWNVLRMLITGKDDKPIEGAKVEVAYDMITHTMQPPNKPVIEKGEGIYEKQIFLGMIGQWRFDFNLKKDEIEDAVSVIKSINTN